MLFMYEAVLLPMSNLPSGIVHTGTHGHWTRPGHHQEVSVDSRLLQKSGMTLVSTCLAVRGQCQSITDTRRRLHRTGCLPIAMYLGLHEGSDGKFYTKETN